jgi:AhpD family alkylhydroperoxidase
MEIRDESPRSAGTNPTPRVEGLSEEAAPLWVRLLWALQRRSHGVIFEPTRIWARAPAALRGFLHLAAAVDRRTSPIEPALRSLVMVKVSQVNSCGYCVDLNSARLQERGADMNKLRALDEYGSSAEFSPKERAALDYAVAMTESGVVDDEIFEKVRAHFDDDALVELTALVAVQNASSKFNAALRIPSQGFCIGLDGRDERESHSKG